MQQLNTNDGVTSYNLSARNLSVVVSRGEDTLDKVTITDFPGDSAPLKIDQIDFATVERDINGDVYRSGKLPLYSVSLSIIPGSSGDLQLLNLTSKEFSGESLLSVSTTSDEDSQWSMLAIYSNIGQGVKLEKGYPIGMTKGYSATAEGRVETHLYNFKFKLCKTDLIPNLVV